MELRDLRLVSIVPANEYRPLLIGALSVTVTPIVRTTIRPLLLTSLSVEVEGVSGQVATFHQLSCALFVYVVGVTKVQISATLALSSGLYVTVRRGVEHLAVMVLSAGFRPTITATIPDVIALSLGGGLGPGAKVHQIGYLDLAVGASLQANVVVKPKTQITVYLAAGLGIAAQIPYTQSDSGLMLAISRFTSVPNPHVATSITVAAPAIAPTTPTITTAWTHSP
jgi:hypothetical protein